MTDYLPHDVDARDDEKLQELQMDLKGQGYAIFWAVLELLWKNGGKMTYKPARLAYNIRWCTAEEVQQVVEKYGLFTVRDGQFWSESLLRRIDARNAKGKEVSDQNRRNANARWHREDATAEDNPTPEDATAMRPQCEGNATAMQNDANNTTQHNTTRKYSSSAPAQTPAQEAAAKAKIYEIFFFKNYLDPAYEVDRFWNYYAASGWMLGEGKPVVDKVALASGWTPEDKKHRLPKDALLWYENFYKEAAANFKQPVRLLTDLAEITRDEGDNIILRYTSKSTAQAVANWRSSHGGYAAVAVQVATKRQPTPNPLP